MLKHKNNFGEQLLQSFARFVEIKSQSSNCCSLRNSLNAWGPELAARHYKDIVDVIKIQPEYLANKDRATDRLLLLFVRSAIRKSLLDIQATPVTIYLPPLKKGPTDAVRTREIKSDRSEEHSKGDATGETSEASHSDSDEQSWHVQESETSESEER